MVPEIYSTAHSVKDKQFSSLSRVLMLVSGKFDEGVNVSLIIPFIGGGLCASYYDQVTRPWKTLKSFQKL